MTDEPKSSAYTAPPGVILLKAGAPYNHGVLIATLRVLEPNPARTYVGRARVRVYELK